MKSIQMTLLAVTAIIYLASCKKKTVEPEPQKQVAPSADVSIIVSNEVDGQPLELGQLKYTNAAGNMYSVNLLKYYLTNVELMINDTIGTKLNNYDLIDASDLSTCLVKGTLPNGTYTKMRFNIGIPYALNHNGAQEGDLDPGKGMIWDWNTGYVFFKHEGKYKDLAGAEKNLAFHFATDRAFTSVEIPFTSNLVVNGNDKKLHITFNLNKLYTTPTDVDFNVDHSRQSSTAADYPWIDNLKLSFADAFVFDKVE